MTKNAPSASVSSPETSHTGLASEYRANDPDTSNSWTPESWAEIRTIVNRGLKSNIYCSIASVNQDGSPHVTPIGSVNLTEPGLGHYFELFTSRLRKNLERDPRFTLLAVDSSPQFWLSSLSGGEFVDHPGIRLTGVAGDRRPCTEDEAAAFRRLTEPLQGLPGHDLLWGNLASVRDLRFDQARPIRFGPMSANLQL